LINDKKKNIETDVKNLDFFPIVIKNESMISGKKDINHKIFSPKKDSKQALNKIKKSTTPTTATNNKMTGKEPPPPAPLQYVEIVDSWTQTSIHEEKEQGESTVPKPPILDKPGRKIFKESNKKAEGNLMQGHSFAGTTKMNTTTNELNALINIGTKYSKQGIKNKTSFINYKGNIPNKPEKKEFGETKSNKIGNFKNPYPPLAKVSPHKAANHALSNHSALVINL
jgi:hypothetical protein